MLILVLVSLQFPEPISLILLFAKGKPKKLTLVAVMRKLLTIINSLICANQESTFIEHRSHA